MRYLVVGGYAATIHGYPRRPKNLDIWIEASPENARRMVIVIKKLGLESLNLTKSHFNIEDQIIQGEFSPYRIFVILTMITRDFFEGELTLLKARSLLEIFLPAIALLGWGYDRCRI